MEANMRKITIDMCERVLRKRFAPFGEFAGVAELLDNEIKEFIGDDISMKYTLPLTLYEKIYLSKYAKEMQAISKVMGIDYSKIVLLNCYYDFISAYMKIGGVGDFFEMIVKKLPLMGCTAFAYNSIDGPVLARNLDWDGNQYLKDLSVIVEYKARLRKESFKTVSWPGLTSVFSGIKTGAFAVTLNMVSSEDQGIAEPATILIRRVLETAESFDQAVKSLSEEPVLSDCLLMVVGVNKGEMVVIERTPTRYAIRYPEDNFIVVTNDYIKFKDVPGSNGRNDYHGIQESSCGRYARASELLRQGLPEKPLDCYGILTDPEVRMGEITDQQMIMCPATGFIDARVPE